MSEMPESLRAILLGALGTAAFFATAFPVLYLFSTWYSTAVGRMVMLLCTSYALALDGTLIMALWRPDNYLVRFWVNLVLFSLLAISSAAITRMLWRTNHSKWSLHRNDKENINARNSSL